MKWGLLITMLLPLAAMAQCKTFRIGVNGDTLNCVDQQDRKQGKWVMHVEALRGEQGYEAEGVFKDGQKEGLWRSYSLNGDLLALENYRWGYKHGTCQYYNISGLYREENWKATNPENPYDTIEVPDLHDPYKVDLKVMKAEGSTVKHGRWQYYEPATGKILKTENYILGKLEDPNKKYLTAGAASDSAMQVRKKLSDDAKPQEVKDYDKKNGRKKSYKERDGKVGY